MNKSLSPPFLYLITDRQQFSPNPRQQIEAIARAAQEAPHNKLLIQIREKDMSAQELSEFVRAAISVARPHGARVLVNDRLDVALAVGADGVHLRTNSLPLKAIRQLRLQTNFLIGVSTHSLYEAQNAEANGADFIVCGPVFSTPSKAMYGAPMGLEQFAEICRSVRLPVLALGGISMTNFAEPMKQGAAGIAGIGIFKNIASLGSDINMMLSFRFTPQD